MKTLKKFRLIALLIVVFFPIIANAQTTVRVTHHYPKRHSDKEMDKVKTDIALMLKYDAAIYYMKIYLMLGPDASDARGAQDKIYECDAMMGK